MPRLLSFDHAHLGKAVKTDEGYLRAPVTLSRTGVADYGYAKKVKLPEELQSKPTVDSFVGIPIVDEHPSIDGEYIFVEPENATKLAKGSVSEPIIEGDTIKAVATIWDKDTIRKVEEGKVEVSLGYWKDDEVQHGEFDGEKFDIVQREIRGNHLAITEKGRMGERVRIELDSKGIIQNKGGKMPKIKYLRQIDGELTKDVKLFSYETSKDETVEVDSKIHSELQHWRNEGKVKSGECDSLKSEVVKLKDEIEAKKGDFDSKVKDDLKKKEIELDAKNAQVEKLEKEIKAKEAEFDSRIVAEAKTMLELQKNAKSLEIDVAEKSNDQIKRDIISKVLERDGHNLSEAEVNPFYEAALAVAKKDKSTQEVGGQTIPENDSLSIQKKRQEELAKLQADYQA